PEGIFTRGRVIKSRHRKILFSRRSRIDERERSSGWPALRVEDFLVGRRPEVLQVRQHAWLQIGNCNELVGIGAAGCGRGHVARQLALARVLIRHSRGRRIRPSLLEAFIVSEQERLVLYDRPANRSTELIAFERRRAAAL